MARQSRGKKIDFTSWTLGSIAFNAIAAGGSAAFAIIGAGSAPATLLRSRGQMMAWYDGVQTPATTTRVAVGMIVMPEGQGTTVVSAPLTDPNAPWFYYSVFTLGYEEYAFDTLQAGALSSYREIIDDKAMRIIRPDREVQVVIESAAVQGAGSAVNVALDARFLLGF